MIQYPNYNNSLLSLINSIEKEFEVKNDHPTLKLADQILEKKFRNVVLMVFDAMGSRNLQNMISEDCFLRKHMRSEISSVFPPTTTAATITLESGLAPAEHSWVGWSLHFPEVEDNVNIFINTNDDGVTVADYHVANKYLPYKNVVEKINEIPGVHAESISYFGTHHVESLEELMEGVEKFCQEDGRHYLYTYWHEPDNCMHQYGVTSEEAAAWVEGINAELEKLSSKLKDTVVFIVSDHGQLDSHNKYIGDYPELLDTLKWLPSIEPRALAFHVKEGRDKDFQAAFLTLFKEDYMLLSRQEVLEKKLFGTGNIHPRLEEFLGDYLAIATNNVTLFHNRAHAESFIGVHAGITEDEMLVPLIVVERK